MKTGKYTAYGALIGLCIGLVLSFFAGCEAVCSCTGEWIDAFLGCGDATCAGGCQRFTSDPIVQGCILYSTLIGAIVGGAYGFFQTLQDKNEALKTSELERIESAKKQRVAWASEVKQKALTVNNTCSRNKAMDKPLVSTTYKANDQMIEIMNELTQVVEKQGLVDSLAEELLKKGGTSV